MPALDYRAPSRTCPEPFTTAALNLPFILPLPPRACTFGYGSMAVGLVNLYWRGSGTVQPCAVLGPPDLLPRPFRTYPLLRRFVVKSAVRWRYLWFPPSLPGQFLQDTSSRFAFLRYGCLIRVPPAYRATDFYRAFFGMIPVWDDWFRFATTPTSPTTAPGFLYHSTSYSVLMRETVPDTEPDPFRTRGPSGSRRFRYSFVLIILIF